MGESARHEARSEDLCDGVIEAGLVEPEDLEVGGVGGVGGAAAAELLCKHLVVIVLE